MKTHWRIVIMLVLLSLAFWLCCIFDQHLERQGFSGTNRGPTPSSECHTPNKACTRCHWRR